MPEVKMNDMNIHYEVDDFTSPWEASETIWIQHGFGRSGEFWFHWVRPLCGSYRVLRVDMRGHANEIRDSPLLAVFIHLLLGKGRVYTQPERLEPAAVSPHNGREHLQGPI